MFCTLLYACRTAQVDVSLSTKCTPLGMSTSQSFSLHQVILHTTHASHNTAACLTQLEQITEIIASPSHVLRIASQNDISTTTCHVGSDGDSLTAPTLGHNLGLALHILRLSIEKLQDDQQQSASNKAAKAGLPCAGKA